MKNYLTGKVEIGGYDFSDIVNNIINFLIAVVTFNVPAVKEYLK